MYADQKRIMNLDTLIRQTSIERGVSTLTFGLHAVWATMSFMSSLRPGRVAQSVAPLTQEPEVPGSIPGPATYFRFSYR